jgi:hypothetical protein
MSADRHRRATRMLHPRQTIILPKPDSQDEHQNGRAASRGFPAPPCSRGEGEKMPGTHGRSSCATQGNLARDHELAFCLSCARPQACGPGRRKASVCRGGGRAPNRVQSANLTGLWGGRGATISKRSIASHLFRRFGMRSCWPTCSWFPERGGDGSCRPLVFP